MVSPDALQMFGLAIVMLFGLITYHITVFGLFDYLHHSQDRNRVDEADILAPAMIFMVAAVVCLFHSEQTKMPVAIMLGATALFFAIYAIWTAVHEGFNSTRFQFFSMIPAANVGILVVLFGEYL